MVVIVATIAAVASISIASANPTGAQPRQIPVYTSHQILNGYADARFHYAARHAQIIDPNKIFTGQVLNIPKHKAYVLVVSLRRCKWVRT